MKRYPFPIGALVVNTGRLRGQGYIWRVDGYRPMWTGDGWDESRQNVVCKNLGPLHGKPERGDYHIGGVFEYLPENLELLGKVRPAYQLELI